MSTLRLLVFVVAIVCSSLSLANDNTSPNMMGQTGLINAPDSRIDDEGSWRFGYSRLKPYSALWTSVSLLPRLEVSARYTQIQGVAAFANRSDANYGDYKDKAFDAKFVVVRESSWIPQVTLGSQDYFGTKLFTSNFVILGKRFYDFDLSLGYGNKRIDGAFGGIAYRPGWAKAWALLVEYDGIDYKSDLHAQRSEALNRHHQSTLAVNYQWGWLGAQLAYQARQVGINAHVTVPLMQPQFIQKIDEPAPYHEQATRASLDEWQQTPQPRQTLYRALRTQGFTNIRIHLQDRQLQIAFSSPRISLVGRSVGRVARTALAMAPQSIESILIHYYSLSDLPIVSYQFNSVENLDRFFRGQLTYGQLLESLTVSYISPPDVTAIEQSSAIKISTPDQEKGIQLVKNRDGQWLSLRQSDESLSRFFFTPLQIGIFFNDPSGAYKYDWFARANYQKQLAPRLFFNAALRATILENVSDVQQASNSELPHVRTDVADYKRDRGIKIDSLLMNKYLQLSTRLYARASFGIYEEMFAGAGGQILYLPREQNWALDLQSDWLRQRDVKGGFGFRDYHSQSSLLNLHYRLPKQGVTLTGRTGQFLAKDRGVRLEFARRFRSGFQIGAWYTKTDGNDITGPGSPGHPYFDKGIFIQIPLNTMLTMDSRAVPLASLSPWTRDVGQMVHSPGDLYRIMENVFLFDRPGYHLLSGFHE